MSEDVFDLAESKKRDVIDVGDSSEEDEDAMVMIKARTLARYIRTIEKLKARVRELESRQPQMVPQQPMFFPPPPAPLQMQQPVFFPPPLPPAPLQMQQPEPQQPQQQQQQPAAALVLPPARQRANPSKRPVEVVTREKAAYWKKEAKNNYNILGRDLPNKPKNANPEETLAFWYELAQKAIKEVEAAGLPPARAGKYTANQLNERIAFFKNQAQIAAQLANVELNEPHPDANLYAQEAFWRKQMEQATKAARPAMAIRPTMVARGNVDDANAAAMLESLGSNGPERGDLSDFEPAARRSRN
jgi:hypothetical protein